MTAGSDFTKRSLDFFPYLNEPHLFAKAHAIELPDDEKKLLKLRQADRPSIFKVIDMSGGREAPGIYLIQDLLSPEVSIRIWDISSSKTLCQGAIILGRAIPI